MNQVIKLKSDLKKASNPEKIKIYKNFHKTSKEGSYAYGEEFLGISIPKMREIARNYLSLSYRDILNLLDSKIHEEKYISSLILAEKYLISNQETKKEIFDFYLKNGKKMSGWDLVDSTAPTVVGGFLLNKNTEILEKLAKSDNLWERRIAIISTYHFIKNNQFQNTLKISQILLNDKHDLIQKAVGWMLREVGKRDQKVLEDFLKKYCKSMPRTMLRYAIELFQEEKRKSYLKGEIQ